MELPDLLRIFLEQGPRWIAAQRSTHRPNGREFASGEILVLESFFDAAILRNVRVVPVARIENPDFYQPLAKQRIAPLLDFTRMSGITFNDTVLLADAFPPPPGDHLRLLFHELVHVVQYQILGNEEFVRQYVLGWAANDFAYEAIPLERQAYELDARFAANPKQGFAAAEAVALGLPRL